SEIARRFKTVHRAGFHQGVNARQRDGGGRRPVYRPALKPGADTLGRSEPGDRDRVYAFRGDRRLSERVDGRDLSGAAGGAPRRSGGVEPGRISRLSSQTEIWSPRLPLCWRGGRRRSLRPAGCADELVVNFDRFELRRAFCLTSDYDRV